MRARGGLVSRIRLVHAGVGKIDDGVFVGVGRSYLIQPRFFGIAYRAGRALAQSCREQVRHGPHQRIHAVGAVALIPRSKSTVKAHLVFQINERVGVANLALLVKPGN